MATMKQLRRVVTGHDGQGRSKVLWDGPAPNVKPAPNGQRGLTDLWAWYETPLPLGGAQDDGNLRYDFPGPCMGGHLRATHMMMEGRPADYDPAKDPEYIPPLPAHDAPSRRLWERGSKEFYSSAMHKTETVDYGIVLEGERELILDDCELVMKPGDIVIQVGAWHKWSCPRIGSIMVFDMISARFKDGPAGVAQSKAPVVSAKDLKLPDGVKPARRIVTIDKEPGKSCLVSDGPAPDVRFDPARPGYAAARLWVAEGTPAPIVPETLHLPHTIEPPKGGSVCRVVTFPPDAAWAGKVGGREVEAYFNAMGSPGASTFSKNAPHPYMQKTRTLDFCIVLEGEIVLVLDTQEVALRKGDIVIQRGTNHAWSNRSGKPAVVSIASHDAV